MTFALLLLVLLCVVTLWGFTSRRNNWDREVAREVAHRAKHVRRTQWMDWARERHFQLWRARAGPTYVLRATREGVGLVIEVYLSEAVPHVHVRARALEPMGRAITAWRADVAEPPAPDDRAHPALEKPTRDASFNAAFRVRGDADGARTVLDERVRDALLAVPTVTFFEYDRGEVRLEWTGGDPSVADSGIDAVVAACARRERRSSASALLSAARAPE